MPNCRGCGKSVTAGLVLCGEECIQGIRQEPDETVRDYLTYIIYFKSTHGAESHITGRTSETSEAGVLRNALKSIDLRKYTDIYFIETKKLIKIGD